MDGKSRAMLIVNPVAGHGRGQKIFARIEAKLRDVFPNLDIRTSEFPGHAFQLGREAAREGYERLLCLGGDGTPFEVINGLYIHGRPSFVPEIGLIPAGTGNSFLRDFGIETPEEAVRRFAAGRRIKVDLVEFEFQLNGKTERRYSLNIIGAGLITDILKLTNDWLKIFGKMGYSLAVLIRLARGMNNTIEIKAGDRAWSVEDSALVVSNSQFTGGRMKIAPYAATADGKADLVIFRDVNRREILQIFKRVFSGSHASHPKVEITQAAEMTIVGNPPLRIMADGEVLGESPLRLKVLPQELVFLG